MGIKVPCACTCDDLLGHGEFAINVGDKVRVWTTAGSPGVPAIDIPVQGTLAAVEDNAIVLVDCEHRMEEIEDEFVRFCCAHIAIIELVERGNNG